VKTWLPAAAKLNLSLVVGPERNDGYHSVATVMQRIDLCDLVELRSGDALEIAGFSGDTIVRSALERLAGVAGVEPRWRVRIEKRIPLAAGLGGGSADAAAALVLANRTLPAPLGPERLHEVAAEVGSDVPFFVEPGPKLVEGRGERLARLEVPQDYWVVVALDAGARKRSTAHVYERFDELGGAAGYEGRRQALLDAVAACRGAVDLALLPGNDLASAGATTRLPDVLRSAGAFRADVSGAGPAVYGLFARRREALAATRKLPRGARSWVTAPVW
jgi:4-diphosphocytidyl-2-C-methyl-D-erythritol kinase